MATIKKLNAEELSKLDALILSVGRGKGVLIPVLQKVQDVFGYIPEQAVDKIANFLKISSSEIYGVITFYAQFYTEPHGKYLIKICRGTACHVRGSKEILDHIKEKLEIAEGETTKDFKFTLETVACLGACALAPLIMINNNFYGKITPQKLDSIIAQL